MNILIDIGHPAHVHLFRCFAKEMAERGHHVLFTCREKEFEIELLKHFDLNFKTFGKKYSTIAGKMLGLVQFDIKEFLTGLKFKPDILLSHGSPYAAHASFLLRKPHISFEDTFNFEQIKLYLPFTQAVLTGDYDHPVLGTKEVQYAGYHGLAYLYSNRFVPNKEIYNFLGISTYAKYVIMRFVSWKATHDTGHKGISLENKIKAIHEFEKYANVFITSEKTLPKELEMYKLKIAPDQMHDAIAYASLLFGESATMSEECAMLGVPSIYIYDKGTFYTKHLEQQYNLVYNFKESESEQLQAIAKGVDILKTDNKSEWQKRRQRMLADKIDVTALLVWFVENFPASKRLLSEHPDLQYQFK